MVDIFAKVGRLVKEAAAATLKPAGEELAGEVRRRLEVPGHGIPSDPGEPPRYQSGGLWKSVSSEVDVTSLRVYVVVDHPAAFYLEYGTSVMAPRPFLRPAAVSFAGRAARFVADHLGGGTGSLIGARHQRAFLASRHAPGVFLE